jgi:hypothetical protein
LKKSTGDGERRSHKGRSEHTGEANVQKDHFVARRPVGRGVRESNATPQDGQNLASGNGDGSGPGCKNRHEAEGEEQAGDLEKERSLETEAGVGFTVWHSD